MSGRTSKRFMGNYFYGKIRKSFIIARVLAFGGHILSLLFRSIDLFFFSLLAFHTYIVLSLSHTLTLSPFTTLCTYSCHHRHLYIHNSCQRISLSLRSKRCTIKCPYCKLLASKQSSYCKFFSQFPFLFQWHICKMKTFH